MDAEQVRDSILFVSGNLDRSFGGPSKDLSPAYTRRTVYGKVSRYKLDAYLQLFDFPSPAISAEKRFTTTVPLQRLFLMNSDFMQAESEELVKRVSAEPDNRSRIKKIYLLAYGRNPSEEEIRLGLDYLRAEPMRQYEENKKKPAEKEGGPRKKKDGEGEETLISENAKPPMPDGTPDMPATPEEGVPNAAGADAQMGMGMMAGMPIMDKMMSGVGGRRGGKKDEPEVKYEPTAWGRYAKLLLSSTEFAFIN